MPMLPKSQLQVQSYALLSVNIYGRLTLKSATLNTLKSCAVEDFVVGCTRLTTSCGSCQELNRKVPKKLKPLIIVALAIGLAYWFARGNDWVLIWEYWRSANHWLLLLAAVFINLTMVWRAWRWQVFLKPISSVSFWDSLAATVLGFGSVFLIGRAGDIIRPLYLSLKTKIPVSATLATILIERVFDMSAVAIIFALNLLLIDLPNIAPADLQRLRVLGALMVLGTVVGFAVLVLLRLKSDWLIGWIEKLFGWLPKKLLSFGTGLLSHISDGLSVLTNLQSFLQATMHTIFVWAAITAAYWLVIKAFAINFSISQVVFVLGSGLVGSLIPTPGGSAGAFHVAAQKGLTLLGIEQNLGASIAIATHFISFGSPFVWAMFYLMRVDVSFEQLRNMMSAGTSGDELPEKANG